MDFCSLLFSQSLCWPGIPDMVVQNVLGIQQSVLSILDLAPSIIHNANVITMSQLYSHNPLQTLEGIKLEKHLSQGHHRLRAMLPFTASMGGGLAGSCPLPPRLTSPPTPCCDSFSAFRCPPARYVFYHSYHPLKKFIERIWSIINRAGRMLLLGQWGGSF